jgi:hypothetical protein
MGESVTAALDAIERIGTHAQKIDEYKKLASRLFEASEFHGLVTFLSRLAEEAPSSGEAVPTMISRQVLQDFVNEIFTSKLPAPQIKELAQATLSKLKTRLSSFEEPFSDVSEKMADILQVNFWRQSGRNMLFKSLTRVPFLAGRLKKIGLERLQFFPKSL